jgi:hypothetical protein
MVSKSKTDIQIFKCGTSSGKAVFNRLPKLNRAMRFKERYVIKLFGFLSLLLFTDFVSAQPKWVLKKEKNGIQVYGLKADTSQFNSIKVETIFRGTMKDLVSIVMDVERHREWAYGTKSALVLKKISEKEIIFYKEIKVPGPASDRDMVIRLTLLPNQSGNSIKIESTALPNFIPKKENLVRVPFSKETWVVTSLQNEKLKIVYYLEMDPGGEIPPVIANLFAIKGPLETFENLKSRLENRVGNQSPVKVD